jgi:hypothetical protein
MNTHAHRATSIDSDNSFPFKPSQKSGLENGKNGKSWMLISEKYWALIV